ncbi:MAG: OmpA family protein [Bacteroidales bacterium]|nr:OmpA family protein [Bacteroidales bacterium]
MKHRNRSLPQSGFLCRTATIIAFILLFNYHPLFNNLFASKIESEAYLEEIILIMDVKGLGKYYVDAVYATDSIYLSITDVFQELRISQEVSLYYDTISGFFVSQDYPYEVNYTSQTITLDKKEFQTTKKELIKTGTGLYLSLEMYGKVFGLHCTFNERSMIVEMETQMELPAIKEMKQNAMRQNIRKISGRYQADSVIERSLHTFNHGMLDWFVQTTLSTNSPEQFNARIAYGSEFLYGETNVLLNFNSQTDFQLKKQQYYWRWVDNEQNLFRQAKVGSINPRSIATIRDPVLGAMVTNTPSQYRKSFGTFTFSDFIEPDWTVELYVNNVLVDYATTDASGFYQFDIPMVYGYSNVKLRFFGPYGEEQTKEQRINIPFNFLPKGDFEYAVRSGIVMDTLFSKFSRAEINYGINSTITSGLGMEYLSSIPGARPIPFVYTSANLFKSVLMNAEYAYDVRAKLDFSYRTQNNLSLRLKLQKFNPDQTAIRYDVGDEIEFDISRPYKIGSNYGSVSAGYGLKRSFPRSINNMANLTFSTRFGRLSANLHNVFKWRSTSEPGWNTNLALNYRLDRRYMFRAQFNYETLKLQTQSIIVTAERRIKNDFIIALSYENFVISGDQGISFSLRYNFPFAQTSASTRIRKEYTTSSLTASGSLAHDRANRFVYANTGKSVGRGGLAIVPFLDLNNNGLREKEEEIIEGLGVISQGGDFIEHSPDSIIRINGLELYTPHLLEFSESDFENISWQLHNRKVKVYPDPNQFKQIMVPVLSVGEAYGMVFIRKNGEDTGQGRIRVNYYNDKNELVYETLTESDGYFTYFGLNPGKYYAELDSNQLKRVNLTALEDSIPFEIEGSEFGDLVGDLNFILIPPPETEIIEKDTTSASLPVETGQEDISADTVLIAGRLLSSDNRQPVVGHIEIIDAESKIPLDFTVSDADSGHFSFMVPARDLYMIEILAKGYKFHYETFSLNQIPEKQGYQKIYLLEKLAPESQFELNNIFFEINKATLREESFTELDVLKRMMDKNPDLKIEIRGHTDITGSYEFNMELSQNRAESVVRYLVTKGISIERLQYKGFGPELPIATNETKEGQQLNRRVGFRVISK